MRGLDLRGVRSVVAVGAHPDDIEIGAGGLLLLLGRVAPDLRLTYVLATGSSQRQAEARAAVAAFLPDAQVDFRLHDLPDGRLPGHWSAVKQIIQNAAASEADLVLVPSDKDAHQDHRLLGELATTGFRDHLVLRYEIPKWDGDMGRPGVYVPLDQDVARLKVSLLHESFPSQKAHDWWDDEVFFGLMRLRGMECRARYAEAFHAPKLNLTVA